MALLNIKVMARQSIRTPFGKWGLVLRTWMSFPIIRELCGEFSAHFYELKQQLSAVDSAVGLRNFETKLKDCLQKMTNSEKFA